MNKIRLIIISFLILISSNVSSDALAVVNPIAGLFSVDNTPQDGPPLSPLSVLIDGNLTASTAINIGWSASAGADRNIGLDLGSPQSINELFVYVDRNIHSSFSNAFSWSVYTSPDNVDTSTWTLHATVVPASFGTLQNRFDIPFPEVNTSFIKVVTSPLSFVFSDQTALENIFVTEMQAVAIVPEPISSALFIAGGATLGFRRYWKKRRIV